MPSRESGAIELLKRENVKEADNTNRMRACLCNARVAPSSEALIMHVSGNSEVPTSRSLRNEKFSFNFVTRMRPFSWNLVNENTRALLLSRDSTPSHSVPSITVT
ncbi:hypothetical protein V1477_017253 [Vespula maculifrons]|uniref:Uncharacterized protein n=1 Tax=Vespula maculifrons TaxID=7453 RepID=A0ABD2B5H1_VESMC